jgi:tetratricopeptide (TPR) repeat protein
VWWEFFREQSGQESPAKESPAKESTVLVRIDRCLLHGGSRFDKPELQQLLADAEASLEKLVESKQVEWWHGLAETCLLHGERELAMKFLEKAAALSSSDALRLGDLHSAEKQWLEAAKWYQRAGEFDKLKPLPLYLLGRALSNAGRKEEGERLAAIALLLPLGNDEIRRDLAAGLKERGYREESLRQFEILLRTGEPGEQPVIEAAKQVGNAVYTQDELRGADCWETMVLCCLRSKWGFVDANGYVQIPFLVHKTRAKGLLKAGRMEEALREVRLSQHASPMNLELPEELIPELQRANRPAEAEDLFQLTSQAIRGLSQDFPNCATLHNNLAWLCARNGRDLEEAIQHAERAVAIDSENSSYIDTLGEVHFRRGDLEQAIACAVRCLRIDSTSKHYQEQLARFRAAKESLK